MTTRAHGELENGETLSDARAFVENRRNPHSSHGLVGSESRGGNAVGRVGARGRDTRTYVDITSNRTRVRTTTTATATKKPTSHARFHGVSGFDTVRGFFFIYFLCRCTLPVNSLHDDDK